jgi:hypothetical protein
MAKKRKAKVGRKPMQLTKEAQERFIKSIRLGAPIRDACGCAGFSESWFYDQQSKALQSPQLAKSKVFKEFLDNIKRVEGEATTRWLAMVEKAAMSGTWQAAAWKLERRRGMTLKVQQEISGPEGGPITHEVKDAKERLLDKLAGIAAKLDTPEDSE